MINKTEHDKAFEQARNMDVSKKLAKRFLSIHSRQTIENEIERAQQAIEESNSRFHDSTYEDGVIEMARWILGLATAPMSEEDSLPLVAQVIYDVEAKEQRYVIGSLAQHYHRELAHATLDATSYGIEQDDLQSTALGSSSQEEFEQIEHPQTPD